MAAKPESKLQRDIARALRNRGAWCEKTHGSMYSAGLPDLIGCYRGHMLGFEVKMPNRRGTVTKLQQKTLDDIAAANGVARVVDSVKETLDILDWIDGHYV